MYEKVLIEARRITAGFLANRRKEIGLTQRQLAEKSGLGIATIKRAENADFFLNTKQLWILCEALDLYFFLEPKESASTNAKILKYRGMPPSDN
jgi:transcriptional regulator with XRE-family HTH domain